MDTTTVVVLLILYIYKKKIVSKESQYMVSHPELGSDPPLGSYRESGHEKFISKHRYT